MIHTKFSNLTNDELLRRVDAEYGATQLELELAKRLADKGHVPLSREKDQALLTARDALNVIEAALDTLADGSNA